MGTGRNIKRPPWSRLYNTPSWQASTYSIYISSCLRFFSPEGLLECACRKHYLFADMTAQQACCNHSPCKVGSPAETLPICGAGLGPRHLNLAGLTWNSLPVGLPQTLPLSQGRRPHCKLQQLMSATPPENGLQLTSRYLSRKKEVISLYQLLPVELVEQLVFSKFSLII